MRNYVNKTDCVHILVSFADEVFKHCSLIKITLLRTSTKQSKSKTNKISQKDCKLGSSNI